MAAPVTHIILALQILHLLPSHFDRDAFLVGTSFPDIRYLAKLDKKITHIEPVSWNDVMTAKSAFCAGMLFHNLVDIVRIKHFEPYFYDRSKAEQYDKNFVVLFPLAMKKSEDFHVYDFCQNWQDISVAFNTVYPEEIEICKDENIVKKWHSFLQDYFQQKPNSNSIEKLIEDTLGQELPHLTKVSLNNYFNTCVYDPFFKIKIEEFCWNFIAYISLNPHSSFKTH